MSIIRTEIIIYDSFNNVLAAQRGKNSLNGSWGLVGKDIKGKENEEKCITKAVDNDLTCTIFDLTPFKEYVINEEKGESLLVYTGVIRQHPMCHKSIKQVKWITEKEISEYNFSEIEKEALTEFFSKL